MAEAAIDRRAELQREADAKARAEAAAAEEKGLWECRRRAWMNYRVDKAQAAGDPAGALFDLFNRPSKTFEQELTPDDGSWPQGVDVNDYRTIAVASAAPAAEGVADPALGSALRLKPPFSNQDANTRRDLFDSDFGILGF